MKALVDGGKVKATLPTALDSQHQKMLDELKAKNGKDFDESTTISRSRRTRMRSRYSLPMPRAATMPN